MNALYRSLRTLLASSFNFCSPSSGVGLNDSPVGLAAYILEKFITWTNQEHVNRVDGGLKLKFKYTDLLDNIMIFWVTNSITTSMRFYAETLNTKAWELGIDK